jgi:signal transduction histidine kinase
MADLMRELDWSATPLGSADAWPETLRSTLNLCLDSAFPIAIYWGPELALLYNDAWSPILGNKHPWALGRPAVEVWPEIWDAIEPVFRRVRETRAGAFNGDSLLAMHRHGYVEECYFDYTFNPIRDGAGGVAGIFNVVIETTYRVINERRGRVLRELSARLSTARSVEEVVELAAQALETAPFDVPCAVFFRLESAEATGARAAKAVRIEDGAALDASAWPIAAALASGAPQRVADLEQSIGALPGGAWPEPPREALVLPIHGPGPPAVDVVLVAAASPRRALDLDYTVFFESVARHLAAAIASAETFEATRRRAEALAEIDRAKTVFFSNVSHELRTPLTLIMGPLNDLLAAPPGALPPGSHELLQLARRNGERLRKLVNNLLEFSRIEAGRVAARYEETDLARLTADLASNFRSACERGGLELRVACRPLVSPAFVDRDMWERIVLNLISNAFKFTLQGEIFVGLKQVGESAVLTVRDTGTGIPAAEQPKLFERFHRIENARARSQEGTGIGLALVYELVKLHGGEVGVESAVNRGTEITVRIPLGRKHLPADRILAEPSPPEPARIHGFVAEAAGWLGGTDTESTAQEPPPLRDAARRKVVVADDNADMRAYLERLLGPVYDVVPAARGDEALDLARRALPDLVVADVMMPGLDGFALLRALRQDERTRSLPVILLSARAGEEARVEGLEAGADDYLVKPFDARELVARVSGAIALAAQRREAERRKDEFLATLAHELRNPLAPLRTASELLKRTPDETAKQAALDVIGRQVSNMSRLIDDLMDLSRISRGKIELRLETVDVNTVLEEAIEATQPLIANAEQTLSVQLPPPPMLVRGDRVRLIQVFTNLLNNASKYSETGARIAVEARLDSKEAVVAVSDDGIGIEPEMLPKVWDMFVQAKRSIERSHGGLGIGLTLVRSLVEMQDGSVEAKSAGPGRGSTFTVRLPLASLQGDIGLAEAEERTPLAPARVLVADDNRDAAAMLTAYLEAMGCEVATAYDGRAALEIAERFRPDVALLDLGMPRLTGLECARELRRERWGQSVMLVALTGWGQEEDRQRSKEAGFDFHLVKPVSPDIVAALVAGNRAAADL